MKYNGIMWGPSVRGYISDNKMRIGRCEASLASLKNQTGQFANEHRMLLKLFHEWDEVLKKHIDMADAAMPSVPSEERQPTES
jgi:hypothetical protein